MTLSSSWTGQGSLQRLPSNVYNYHSTTTTNHRPVITNDGIGKQHTMNQPQQSSPSSSSSLLPSLLPISVLSPKMIESYPLPDNFIQQPPREKHQSQNRSGSNTTTTGTNNANDDGIAVLKLNKSGVLQSRRFAFTNDRRHVSITSRRIKSVKNLFNLKMNFTSSNNASSLSSSSILSSSSSSLVGNPNYTNKKFIPISNIDRIEIGPYSPRFLKVEQLAMYGNLDSMEIVQKYIRTRFSENSNPIVSTSVSDNNKNNNNNNNNSNTNKNNNDTSANNVSNNSSTILFAAHCCCLSIVYRSMESSTTGSSSSSSTTNTNNTITMESLDLVIPNVQEYQLVCQSLQELIHLSRLEQHGYTVPMQYVRYHYTESYKDYNSTMSIYDVIQFISERIPIPSSLYQQSINNGKGGTTKSNNNINNNTSSTTTLARLCHDEWNKRLQQQKSLGIDSGNVTTDPQKERLSLTDVVSIIERVKETIVPVDIDPIQKLWNELVATDPVPQPSSNVPNNDNNTNTNTNTNTNRTNDRDKRGRRLNSNVSSTGDEPKNELNTSHNNNDYDDDHDHNNDDASLEISLQEYNNRTESISAIAFLSFLRSQQKCYSMTLEEAATYIRRLREGLKSHDNWWYDYDDNTNSNTNNISLNDQYNYSNDNNNNQTSTTTSNSSNRSTKNTGVAGGNIPTSRSSRSSSRQHPLDSTKPMIGTEERLSKALFMSWIISDINDILDRSKATIGIQDMNKPISHYWINTSHDTYIEQQRQPPSQILPPTGSNNGGGGGGGGGGGTVSSKGSVLSCASVAEPVLSVSSSLSPPRQKHQRQLQQQQQQQQMRRKTSSNTTSMTSTTNHFFGPNVVDGHMYLSALYRGVRCLELDVWHAGTIDEPVIGRRIDSNSSTTIPLKIVLRVIQYFLLRNPETFPILLKIENHVSNKFILQKMAQHFHDFFGKHGLLATPSAISSDDSGSCQMELSANVRLPTPNEAKGKVILIGKRPKQISNVMTVINDDFDDENDVLNEEDVPIFDASNSDGEGVDTSINDDMFDDMEQAGMHVVGFDTKGPIYGTTENRSLLPSTPTELLHTALLEARQAQHECDEAIARHRVLIDEVTKYEQLTAEYTQLANLSPMDVKCRAALAANRVGSHDFEDDDDYDDLVDVNNSKSLLGQAVRSRSRHGAYHDEEKSSKDEGIEVHEVVPSFVEQVQDSFVRATQDAKDAATKQATLLLELKEAQNELHRAECDLEMSRELERIGIENAKKAAVEARLNVEAANAARERVEQVRGLVQNSKNQSSSAGTVVQTALTEAKISEKRAQEAAARAARAMASATKDRAHAEAETKREEQLEQETTALHSKCSELAEEVAKARDRAEKATMIHDKLNEQIKLIERSSQYRQEKAHEQNSGVDHHYVRHGGSFIAKHDAKFQELLSCRAVLREAIDEKCRTESQLLSLKRQFEDRAYQWRSQADLAAQLRKAADRSAAIAEEVAEHAEEEREAAKLRQIAREKALASVENKYSQHESVEGQLAQAERAALEASKLAAESKKRADRLSVEAERVQDHSRFLQTVAERQNILKLIQQKYDVATAERDELDRIAKEEQQRLHTNSLVYRSAAQTAATENDRTKTIQKYEEEAVEAYNRTLQLRKELDSATTKAEIAISIADAKRIATKRARDYKEKRDKQIEIPIMMSKMTFFHTLKFRQNWKKSQSLSNVHIHSIAQNVLLQMMVLDVHSGNSNPRMLMERSNRKNLQLFTKTHICRVFPPWKSIVWNNSAGNMDPVLAWSLGCQLVGMNYHCPDETLLVGDGRFRQNGSCGYVLKPKQLRSTLATSGDEPTTEQSWSFCILGAYNLPKVAPSNNTNSNNGKGTTGRIVSPFVKLSLYEGSTEETRILFKTKPSLTKENGLNPIWDSKQIFCFKVQNPSVAMLSFTIWDSRVCRNGGSNRDEDGGSGTEEVFIAGAAVPVSCLQQGYRSVALFDINHSRSGPYALSSLLLKASCTSSKRNKGE